MRHRLLATGALLLSTLLLSPAVDSRPLPHCLPKAGQGGSTQPQPIATTDLKLLITAEGRSSIPAGSKIEWQGAEDACQTQKGEVKLRAVDATPVNFPVCKVRLTLFVTGFSTKAVTLDLAAHRDLFGEPIHIGLKTSGDPEVTWRKDE